MTDPKTTKKLVSLYPRHDTLKEVELEAISQLPIETSNDLIALLKLHENTIIFLQEEIEHSVKTDGLPKYYHNYGGCQ